MKYVVVDKKNAEETRRQLAELGLIDNKYEVVKKGDKVFFPVKECPDGFECVEMEGKPKQAKPKSLKEALSHMLTAEELDELVTSFDIVGDIAIIQIPDRLADKAREIGKALMKVHPNVHVVCQKLGARKGIFRLAPLRVIAGEDRFTTTYKENGVRMKVDVLKAYFSPRLSTERLRIAKQVKDGETVAVFFAGVGPFALVIAKMKKVKVYAVELNPYAFSLMEENVRMNKLAGEIIPIQGDVRKVYKELPPCDRVVMPLPKGGEDFLDIAFKTVKPGGMIHFYQFAPEDNLYEDAINRINKTAKDLGRRVEIVNKKIVRPHKPRVYQVVIDFKVF